MLRSSFLQRFAAPMARVFAIALLAGLVFLTPAAQPQTTDALGRIVARQNISNTGDQSEVPQIDYNVGRLAAVWGERFSANIDLSTTTLGASWPPELSFRTGSLTAYQSPAVVIDAAGTTHFAYATGDRVYHRARLASGALTAVHLIGSANFPNPVRMALGIDGKLWVVWRDADGTALFYKYSRDGGVTWINGSDGGIVAAETGNMFSPDIAVDRNGSPHVVWYLRSGGSAKGDIRFADWTGSRFAASSLTTDGTGLYDADPAITVDGRNVQHVVWRKQAGSNWVIFYAHRVPGRPWEGYTPLTTTKGDAKYPPAIGTDSLGTVYVSYSNPLPGSTRRVQMFSKLANKSWEGPLVLSNGPWDSHSSVVGSANNAGIQAHVLLQHEVGADDGEIIYSRILAQGCAAQSAQASDDATVQMSDNAAVQAKGATRRVYLPFISKASVTTFAPAC